MKETAFVKPGVLVWRFSVIYETFYNLQNITFNKNFSIMKYQHIFFYTISNTNPCNFRLFMKEIKLMENNTCSVRYLSVSNFSLHIINIHCDKNMNMTCCGFTYFWVLRNRTRVVLKIFWIKTFEIFPEYA